MPRRLCLALVILAVLSAPAAAAASADDEAPPRKKRSLIERLGEGLDLHKTNYILPVTWGNRAAGSEDAEVKFQLSIRQRILDTHLYFAYTQKSFWRVWDQEDSRPFRETNHNPEIFYRWERDRFRPGWLALAVGAEHESNGAREPTSRSWNRLYLQSEVEAGRFWCRLKLWYRLSEEVKRFPEDPAGDENPDIEDFLGNGEIRLGCDFRGGQKASLMGRYNPGTGKGALQVDFSLPSPSRNAYLYLQLFTGYGESLIDYHRSLTRYGVGIRFRLDEEP